MANSQNLSSDVAKANQDLEKFNKKLLEVSKFQNDLTKKIGKTIREVRTLQRVSENSVNAFSGMVTHSRSHLDNLKESSNQLRKQYDLMKKMADIKVNDTSDNHQKKLSFKDKFKKGFGHYQSIKNNIQNIDFSDQMQVARAYDTLGVGATFGSKLSKAERDQKLANYPKDVLKSQRQYGVQTKDALIIEDHLIGTGKASIATQEGNAKLTEIREAAYKYKEATGASSEEAGKLAASYLAAGVENISEAMNSSYILGNTMKVPPEAFAENYQKTKNLREKLGFVGSSGDRKFMAVQAAAIQAGYSDDAIPDFLKTVESKEFSKKQTKEFKDFLGGKSFDEYATTQMKEKKITKIEAFQELVEKKIEHNDKDYQSQIAVENEKIDKNNTLDEQQKRDQKQQKKQQIMQPYLAKYGTQDFQDSIYGASAQDGALAYFSADKVSAENNLNDQSLRSDIDYAIGRYREQAYYQHDRNSLENSVIDQRKYEVVSPVLGTANEELANFKQKYPNKALALSFTGDAMNMMGDGGGLPGGMARGAVIRPALGITGAAISGGVIGTQISNRIQKSKYGESFNNVVGGAETYVLAKLGNKTAKETLEYKNNAILKPSTDTIPYPYALPKRETSYDWPLMGVQGTNKPFDYNQIVDNITSQSINNQSSLEVLGQQTKLLEENKQIFCNGFAGVINAIQCAKPITIVSPEYKPNSIIPDLKENRHGATT